MVLLGRSLNLFKSAVKSVSAVRFYSPVSHVIYDLDGLLMDTESLYEQADTQILREFGRDYSWRLKKELIGCTDKQAAKIVIDYHRLNIEPQKYLEKWNELCYPLLTNAKLKRGAEDIIRHLHKHKIPQAICTGASRVHFDWKTSHRRRLFSLFHHVLTVNDEKSIEHGKPHPACYLLCASRFNDAPTPDKVLVFEDSPKGLQSALAANMQVVLVPDDFRVDEDTKRMATLCIDSLDLFDFKLFGLPKMSCL